MITEYRVSIYGGLLSRERWSEQLPTLEEAKDAVRVELASKRYRRPRVLFRTVSIRTIAALDSRDWFDGRAWVFPDR